MIATANKQGKNEDVRARGMRYEVCARVPRAAVSCLSCLTELVPQLHCLAAANDHSMLPVHHEYS